MKTGKEIITFGDIEIEKHKLDHYKSPTLLEGADTDNLLLSNKTSTDEKTINALLVTRMVIIKLTNYK